jgi:chromosome segregation ATPase
MQKSPDNKQSFADESLLLELKTWKSRFQTAQERLETLENQMSRATPEGESDRDRTLQSLKDKLREIDMLRSKLGSNERELQLRDNEIEKLKQIIGGFDEKLSRLDNELLKSQEYARNMEDLLRLRAQEGSSLQESELKIVALAKEIDKNYRQMNSMEEAISAYDKKVSQLALECEEKAAQNSILLKELEVIIFI